MEGEGLGLLEACGRRLVRPRGAKRKVTCLSNGEAPPIPRERGGPKRPAWCPLTALKGAASYFFDIYSLTGETLVNFFRIFGSRCVNCA